MNTLHGNMQIEVGVRPGSLLGLTNSAQGKVALAAMSDEDRERSIPTPLPEFTKFTITDRDRFDAHLKTIHQQGWATAPNEALLGLNALACAITNSQGQPVATVAIVSLTQHIETPPSSEQIRAVSEAARLISSELG